ncbi:MAG TPA: OsmC family protein [Moheibacter sp.]|nr:OsmC family protein [Moheibacter sp.]
MKTHKAGAIWKGSIKDGNGTLSTKSNVLNGKQYSFKTRFENGDGTNPDELLAASHAGCYAMALSKFLGDAGYTPNTLDATAEITMDPEKLALTTSHLTLKADIPNISNEEFQQLAQAAKDNCPISKVMNLDISLDAELI